MTLIEMSELGYQDIKSTAYIDAIVDYAETLLGIEFKNVKKNRYSSLCPFHADTKNSLMVYVNKKNEIRLHWFGACRGDWDNGYHLAQTIKKNAHETKVIIMTGRPEDDCLEMMASQRVDGWLFKPFGLKQLGPMLSLLWKGLLE